jgi:hypothetical protein
VVYRERRVRNRVSARAWEIRTSLGPYERAGADASGWLWEVGRGEQRVHVIVEVSKAAWSTDPLDLPDDTRRALETDGRTELLKVLGHDEPPHVIRCGSRGCRHLAAAPMAGRAEQVAFRRDRSSSVQADGPSRPPADGRDPR